VADSVVMEIVKGRDDLAEKFESFVLRETFSNHEKIEEFAVLRIFGDVVKMAIALKYFINAKNVWVIEET
jgi:hypothetical protein